MNENLKVDRERESGRGGGGEIKEEDQVYVTLLPDIAEPMNPPSGKEAQ